MPPKVLHYGLDWKIGMTGYEFDKHWFYDFDALRCPPWNLSTDRSEGGLFKHPPHPALYHTKASFLSRPALHAAAGTSQSLV